MKEFPTLSNEEIILIPLKEHHLQDLYEIYSDEQAMEFYDFYPHKNQAQTKKVLDLYMRRFDEKTGIRWGIQMKDDHRLIGTIGINKYIKDRLGFLGADLNRYFWSKGVMTDALNLVTEFGFNELQVNRLEAHVQLGNEASEKVLRKCGYSKEGVHREREFYKDKHQTLIMYAKLRTDN